jgi:hypothetical protein
MSLLHYGILNGDINTGTRFLGPWGGQGFTTTTVEDFIVMPFAATLHNLRLFAVTGVGGTGSTAWTLRVNGVASALTTTIAHSTSPYLGSDLTHTVSVVAGDIVSLSWVHSLTAASAGSHLFASVDVVPTASGDRSVLSFSCDGTSPSTAARFLADWFSVSAALTVESFILAPRAGTLRNLFARARTAPTGAGNAVYTGRINGVDSALTTTVAHAASPHAGSDTTHTVSVAQFDRIGLQIQHSLAPSTNGADFLVSMEFEATP